MNSRRDFLKTSAGLLVAFALPERSKLNAQGFGRGPAGPPKPNAFIRVAPDDSVTFIITKCEMGQGTVTSLSQLLADELDCDWSKVRTEFAPVDPALYGMQGVLPGPRSSASTRKFPACCTRPFSVARFSAAKSRASTPRKPKRSRA
jgi:isoquinoline 1-oxidoreductase beta subunit